MQAQRAKLYGLADRALIGGAILLVLVLTGVRMANSAEVIPALGLTRPAEGDADAKLFGSLALRGNIFQAVKGELEAGYRSDDMFDDQLHVRMVPLTASLWFTPMPALYAGGGVGMYLTKYDYDQDVIPFPVEDETTQDFGVHLGGGLRFPLAPSASMDLQGRYVMLREKDSQLVPEQFDPDFWMAKAGIAFSF